MSRRRICVHHPVECIGYSWPGHSGLPVVVVSLPHGANYGASAALRIAEILALDPRQATWVEHQGHHPRHAGDAPPADAPETWRVLPWLWRPGSAPVRWVCTVSPGAVQVPRAAVQGLLADGETLDLSPTGTAAEPAAEPAAEQVQRAVSGLLGDAPTLHSVRVDSLEDLVRLESLDPAAAVGAYRRLVEAPGNISHADCILILSVALLGAARGLLIEAGGQAAEAAALAESRRLAFSLIPPGGLLQPGESALRHLLSAAHLAHGLAAGLIDAVALAEANRREESRRG